MRWTRNYLFSSLFMAADVMTSPIARTTTHVGHRHSRGQFETLTELAYCALDEGQGVHFFGVSYDSVSKTRALEKRYVFLSMAVHEKCSRRQFVSGYLQLSAAVPF
jgi:hypothetical protein